MAGDHRLREAGEANDVLGAEYLVAKLQRWQVPQRNVGRLLGFALGDEAVIEAVVADLKDRVFADRELEMLQRLLQRVHEKNSAVL